jgi:hypothetical protein
MISAKKYNEIISSFIFRVTESVTDFDDEDLDALYDLLGHREIAKKEKKEKLEKACKTLSDIYPEMEHSR